MTKQPEKTAQPGAKIKQNAKQQRSKYRKSDDQMKLFSGEFRCFNPGYN